MVAARIAAGLIVLALPAAAAETSVWTRMPDTTSASLAELVSQPMAEPGWGLLSSSVIAKPDGSRVLVTFWEAMHERRLEGTGIYRCVDELTPEGETVRAFCATPRLEKK